MRNQLSSVWIVTIVVVLMASLIRAPSTAGAQDAPPDDVTSHPTVNYHNPSRRYQRPVRHFFEAIGFQANFAFASRYVWNNIAYSEGPVWQPTASVEFYGFGLAVLGNLVLNDEPNQGQFNEVDLTVYYGNNIKKLEIDFAITFSIYPNDNPDSLNFGANAVGSHLHLAYPLGPIDLFTDLGIWILDPRGGLFWDVGVAYQKSLPANFAVSTAFLFGLSNGRYNEAFIGSGLGTGPNMINYSLAFPYSPLQGLIITPEFNVSTFLTSGLRAAVRFPTNIWGQLTVGYHF